MRVHYLVFSYRKWHVCFRKVVPLETNFSKQICIGGEHCESKPSKAEMALWIWAVRDSKTNFEHLSHWQTCQLKRNVLPRSKVDVHYSGPILWLKKEPQVISLIYFWHSNFANVRRTNGTSHDNRMLYCIREIQTCAVALNTRRRTNENETSNPPSSSLFLEHFLPRNFAVQYCISWK